MKLGNPLGRLRSWLSELRPARVSYPRTVLTIFAVGLPAALVAGELRIPLPFILGPLIASLLLSLAGARLSLPNPVRAPMLVVLGAMIGSSVTPDMLALAGGWIVPMMGLFAVISICTLAAYWFNRVVGRLDPATAYFSAVPGGLAEMILVGESRGGNMQAIALSQSARVAFVVLAVPFLLQMVTGVALGTRPPPGVPFAELPITSHVGFVLTCIAGASLGGMLPSATGTFLSSMSISALVHALGITDFKVPTELALAAQMIIGLSLGVRFAGWKLKQIGVGLALSIAATLIMLTVAFAGALAFEAITGEDLAGLFLAYAPGGVAEMSLVAASLHIDAAMVVVHHLVRIFAITLLARHAYSHFIEPRHTSSEQDR
jgi:membrane AbrB-like protein